MVPRNHQRTAAAVVVEVVFSPAQSAVRAVRQSNERTLRIRSATARLEKRREEFKDKTPKREEFRTVDGTSQNAVRGLEMQFQTLEKKRGGESVDAIGDGAEKKLREKFKREERWVNEWRSFWRRKDSSEKQQKVLE